MEEKKLREELGNKFVELSQKTQEKIRKGEIQDDSLQILVNDISLLEKRLYDIQGKNIPSKEEMKCPSCGQAYEEGTVFCGNCGTNIKEFYEQVVANCKTCNGIINEKDNFCGICGSKSK